MLKLRNHLTGISLLAISLFAIGTQADVQVSTVAVSGYDVVSYHSPAGPVRGEGTFVSEHAGVTYLFATAENRAAFEANPDKYLPAYGGYCAMGVAMGKKFHVDPLSWKIVDDTLYLNLNKSIQKRWLEDVPGHIQKADANWTEIHDVPAAQL